MLVLSASLVACSSSSTDGTGGGNEGGGTGEGGDTNEGGGTPAVGTGATGTTTATTATTTTGGGTCSVPEFFDAGPCDACFLDACCAEAEACIADAQAGGEDCIVAGTTQFSDGPLADAVFACQETNCAEECSGGGICGTGVGFVDQNQEPLEELNECLDEFCCDGIETCYGDFSDAAMVEACDACLADPETGGAQCDALIACDTANSCGLVNYPICESGLSLADGQAAECLSTNCCTEFTDCAGGDPEDTAAVQACINCFNAAADGSEPGELCAAAVACTDTNACFGE